MSADYRYAYAAPDEEAFARLDRAIQRMERELDWLDAKIQKQERELAAMRGEKPALRA